MYSHRAQHTSRAGTSATNAHIPRTQRTAIPSAPTRGQFTFGATPERGSITNTVVPTREPAADRPIAHVRAKRYAFQQPQSRESSGGKSKNETPKAATPNEIRRGMRRTRSIETSQSPEQAGRQLESTSGTGFSRRVPQRIGVDGRQQSESAILAGQPPTRRLRTTPSSDNLHPAPGRSVVRPNANVSVPASRTLPPRHPHASAQHNRTPLRGNGGSRTQPQTMRTGLAGSNTGNTTVVVSPAAPRSWTRRIPSSPGNADVINIGLLTTQIPYPPLSEEPSCRLDDPSNETLKSFRQNSRDLIMERESNEFLLEQINKLVDIANTSGLDLAQAREEAAEADKRAERSQRALEEQHIENEKLQKRIAALTIVIKAQSEGHFTANLAPPSPVSGQSEVTGGANYFEGNDDAAAEQEPDIGDNWRGRCANMNLAIRAAYDACDKTGMLEVDGVGAQRDRRIVEEYLNGHAGTASNLHERFLPDTAASGDSSLRKQPSLRNDEGALHRNQPTASLTNERVRRRRSNLVFAPFIRPSGRARARVSSHERTSGVGEDLYEFDSHDLLNGDDDFEEELNCERCGQLLESLHLLELDNDYYREANDKLRSNLTEVTSSHNAMVHAFQCERQRLKDIRHQKLTDAMNVAARNRAILETQQRADLEISGDSVPQHADSASCFNGERQIDGDESLFQRFDRLRIGTSNANRNFEHTTPPSM
ncbi:hypothetical protein H4R24_001845 [Coemansia sp. RSA 988]|nr:hypothetical protein H4R24_001845 [Coemansia sp. RSA 988]